MNASKTGLAILIAGVFLFGLAFSQDSQAEEYKPKAVVTSLVERPLAGVDGKTVIIKHFSLPAGFVGGKHFHPGPVFVYILEGTLTIQTKNGTKTISKGELYQEVPREVMWAENISSSKPIKFVVFKLGDSGKPMRIKAK